MPTGLPETRPRPGSASERERIAAAAIAVVGERGFETSSIELVVERAGLDRDAFDRHFADLQDCCSQLNAEIARDFNEAVFGAIAASGAERWRDRLRVAGYAAARYVREHPAKIRFRITGLLDAGETVQAERDRQAEPLVDLVDEARAELDDPGSIGRAAAESTVGSILGLLLREVREHGRVRDAEAILPEVMYIAVRPYFGEDVAREELGIPPPQLPGRNPPDPEAGTHGLPRLPPGRHGLSREFVAQNQRDRLVAGIIAAVAASGYHEATISEIAAAAGVSRRTFYAYFSSKEECFLATYDIIAKHLAAAAATVADHDRPWAERVQAKLGAALDFFAANPDLVRFYLSAPPRAGEAIAARYRLGAARVLTDLTDGMPAEARRPPPSVQNAMTGSIAALIVRKVEAGEGERLPELLPDLVELFLTPYLGHEAAAAAARTGS